MKANLNTKKVPVIVLFTMPKCIPCIHLKTILEELSEDYKNRAIFGSMRADEYLGNFPISSVPFLTINCMGSTFEMFQGLVSKEMLAEKLDGAIEEMERLQDGDST